MSIKSDLVLAAVGVAVVVAGAWYVKRQAGAAVASIGQAVGGTASLAWGTAQTPITSLGAANGIATSIVDAPSNALDALSLGLISGAGGNTGNGGIGPWLWNIVSGAAFAPSTAAPNLGAVDLGNGGW